MRDWLGVIRKNGINIRAYDQVPFLGIISEEKS